MATLQLLPNSPEPGGDLSDARAAIEQALSTSVASDAARVQILDFMAGHDDALWRTCLTGHLTASALIVDDARERILVMLHSKLGMWLQQGGHADGEGHLAAVALKEATEETGIQGLRIAAPAVDCDVHTIPARPDEPEHLHLDVRYVVVAPANASVQGNHESLDLRWVLPGELHRLASDSSLRRLAAVGLDLAQQLRRPGGRRRRACG